MNIFLKHSLKYLLSLISIVLVNSCSDSGITEPYWGRITYNISRAESDGNIWSRLFTVPLLKERHNSNFQGLSCDSYGNIYTVTTWGGIYKYNRANGKIDSINVAQLGYTNWPTFTSILSLNNSFLFCFLSEDRKFSVVLYKNGTALRKILEEDNHSNYGQIYLSPNGTIYLYSENHLYVSVDNGYTWKIIATDVDGITQSIHNITFDKYANVFLATNKGVYYSQVGKNNFKCIGLSGTYISNIQFNSKDWLYALNSSQMFISKDHGSTWTQLESYPSIGTGCFYINKYNVLFLGTGDGIFRSTDYGETWEYVGLRNISVEKFTEGINGELLALTWRNGIYVSKK
ncbi:MAG: hypothetical protein Q8S39_03975 [Ignavibacteria bacterium]|nr:hypothetical protein [Ignavibacteria bacterium]